MLGYVNPRDAIAKHCRQKGVTKRYTLAKCDVAERDASSKSRLSQEMTYINEGNLYRLIIKSRKPEAEPFESWVCDEVLPSIRKTGKYELQLLENIEQLSSNPVQLEPPTITKAQEGVLFNKVKVISGGRGKIRAELWSRFQNHYSLSSYKYLPADKYEDAVQYLEAKQKEYLGEVEMFYISSKEIAERVKTLVGELVEKPKNAIVINIDIHETDEIQRYFVCNMAGSTTIQKLSDGYLLRFATENLREKGYIILKKDTIVSKLEA